MRKIIAYIGFEGSGKDYLTSKALALNENSTRIGFSDGVRRATFKHCGVQPKYGKEYNKWKEEVMSKFGKTGREMLLQVGEGLRIGTPHVWSQKWYFTATWSCRDVIVVNDCRFGHEALAIIELANIWDAEVEFIFCNFKSPRYKVSNEPCDRLAYSFHISGYYHGQNIDDEIHKIAQIYRESLRVK